MTLHRTLFPSPPKSHPYVATVRFDPVRWSALRRMTLEIDELHLLHVDQSAPDIWTARIGCASEAVCDKMEDWE
jgi:hypothetical protein